MTQTINLFEASASHEITVSQAYQTIKDVALQHGYVASIYMGSYEIEKRVILTPWQPNASEATRMIAEISSNLRGRWGVPVIVLGPKLQCWDRKDYSVSMADIDVDISIIAPAQLNF